VAGSSLTQDETRRAQSTPSILPFVPQEKTFAPEQILDRFVEWVVEAGFELYPAQEEALLELMSGHHLILSTPTGSGKSLVALGLHFKAFCEGKRSIYTSPIKALASEKFFDLCRIFGPENVGLLTGDASINPNARIIGCTQEVLANMALRMGERVDAPYVIMDEFHYYADRERGWAWQVPLLTLPHTNFLLMSATLGNMDALRRRIARDTGRGMVEVYAVDRPVPLDFTYSEDPLHETVAKLLQAGKAPIYIVNFTHRECAERAQALTSLKLCDKAQSGAISKILNTVRFSSPYGNTIKRLLSSGIGVHFAGLLPKYRLLVEQLAQKGLLQVICGTDTLGVGVNVPIRTVLFTQLSKFDGEKVRILRVRDFQQIAGRAGRKGFDEQGSVVAQAPEHVIENMLLAQRAASSKRSKKFVKKKAPQGFVTWNRDTFERLAYGYPEPLESRFRVTHGMILSLLPREGEVEEGDEAFFSLAECGYKRLVKLIYLCHESEKRKKHLLREAAVLFRSLRQAGLVVLQRDPLTKRLRPFVPRSFQFEFSLHETLSLYLIEVIEALDPEHPRYALDLLSAVEAILENPRTILMLQMRKEKGDLIARLKAQGVPYEDRIRKVEQVSYPEPCAEFLYQSFRVFEAHHPWVGGEGIHPKGIARAMVEQYSSFDDFIRELAAQRAEGVLLRYLGQVYKVLVQTVPESARTEEVYDLLTFFETMLARVDSSLLDAWEAMREKAEGKDELVVALEVPEDTRDRKRSMLAQIRRAMHELVQALAQEDYERAARLVLSDPSEHPSNSWDAQRLEEAMEPFYEEHGEIVFTPLARRSDTTQITPLAPGRWEVMQTLLDPAGENFWHISSEVFLSPAGSGEDLSIRLIRIGI